MQRNIASYTRHQKYLCDCNGYLGYQLSHFLFKFLFLIELFLVYYSLDAGLHPRLLQKSLQYGFGYNNHAE